MLNGLEERILADARLAAEYQRMIDLLFGSLHAMREPGMICPASFG